MVATQPDFEKKLQDWLGTFLDYSSPKGWHPFAKDLDITIQNCHEKPTQGVTFTFNVIKAQCDPNEAMHGGSVGLLGDDLCSILLGAVSRPGYYSQLGANRGITTNFIRPMKLGDKVRVVTSVVYIGGKRVLLRSSFYQLDQDELYAIVESDRTNTDPVPVKGSL